MLINAEKLKKSYEWWEGNDRKLTRDEAKHYFDAMIDAQATIEAEPIKHGRWKVILSGTMLYALTASIIGYQMETNMIIVTARTAEQICERWKNEN